MAGTYVAFHASMEVHRVEIDLTYYPNGVYTDRMVLLHEELPAVPPGTSPTKVARVCLEVALQGLLDRLRSGELL